MKTLTEQVLAAKMQIQAQIVNCSDINKRERLALEQERKQELLNKIANVGVKYFS